KCSGTPRDSGGSSTVSRARFVVGSAGLGLLLTACGGGVGADGAQPTVLESAPSSPEEPTDDSTDSEESDSPPSPGEEEASDAEPVPASSEGPAENWPEPDIPEEIYEPTEEG